MKIVFIFIALILVGCGGFKELEPMNYYTINSSYNLSTKHKYPNKTLKVSYPLALNRVLAYDMNFEYIGGLKGSYQNSQWREPLNKLIRANIINTLNSAKVFKATIPVESTVMEDYRLEITVNKFKNVIENNISYAVVDMDISLVNMDNLSIVKRKKFKYKESSNSLNAKGYVDAVNRVFKKLDKELIDWI